MQEPADKLPVGPHRNNIRDMIEKVLLSMSHEEQKRVRQMSLSEICRLYAVISTYQHKRKVRKSKSSIHARDTGKEIGCIRKCMHNQARSNKGTNIKRDGSYAKVLQVGDNESYAKSKSQAHKIDDDGSDLLINKPATTQKDVSAEIVIPDANCDQKEDDGQISDVDRQTNSECGVDDAKFVQLKQASDIPHCERLWRFAIINRQMKNNFKEAFEPGNPSARSNETIYRGLMQKLKEAKEEEEKINAMNRKESSETKAQQSDDNKPKTKPIRHKQVEKRAISRKHRTASFSNRIKESPLLQNIKSGRQSSSNASIQSTRSSASLQKLSPLSSLSNTSNSAAVDREIAVVNSLWETSDGVRQREEFQVKPETEAKKSMYDNVIKKRLACGNHLNAINNEIICKKYYPRSILSRETAKKYSELKTDYLKLCYQESSIRQQIAMLEAEINTMQERAFYKRPAAFTTINLGSKPINPSYRSDTPTTKDKNGSVFPRLEAPKRFTVPQNYKTFQGNYPESFDGEKIYNCWQKTVHKSSHSGMGKIQSEQSDTSFPSISENGQSASVCSLYSLTSELPEVPIKRQSEVLMVPKTKSSDRLPNARSCDRLPNATCSDQLPPNAKSNDRLPNTKSNDRLPNVKSSDQYPNAKSSDRLPNVKSSDRLPNAKRSDRLPNAKRSDRLPNVNRRTPARTRTTL